ncbi:MAG: hypothetical protein U0136_07720 [Bdellovibrionota bacterium]
MITRIVRRSLVAALVLAGLLGISAPVHSRSAAGTLSGPTAVQPKRGSDPATLVATVETDRYRLYYPILFNDKLAIREVLTHLEAAFDRVEAEMGPFKKKVSISIPAEIPSAEAAAQNLVIAGLTWEENKNVYVLVALWSAGKVDTFAHELMHARLRDAGVHPAHWFEEGLAHFIETDDGFNQELFDVLEAYGPLSTKEAAQISGITKDEMRSRATAWAIVYYLHNIKGESLQKIATSKHLPDAKTAFAALRKLHLQQSH